MYKQNIGAECRKTKGAQHVSHKTCDSFAHTFIVERHKVARLVTHGTQRLVDACQRSRWYRLLTSRHDADVSLAVVARVVVVALLAREDDGVLVVGEDDLQVP